MKPLYTVVLRNSFVDKMASGVWCRCRAKQLMGIMAWRSQRGIAQTTILLQQTPGEKKVANVLQGALAPNKLSVKDISGTVHARYSVLIVLFVLRVLRESILYLLGGCGSMFEIVIEAEGFRGKRTVQQHQMVNNVSWTAAAMHVQRREKTLLHCLSLLT